MQTGVFGSEAGADRDGNGGPDEDADPRDGDDDALDGEEVFDFLRRDEHERELNEPV